MSEEEQKTETQDTSAQQVDSTTPVQTESQEAVAEVAVEAPQETVSETSPEGENQGGTENGKASGEQRQRGHGGGNRRRNDGGNRRGGGQRRRRDDREPEVKEFTETLVKLNRVAKVLKGGRRFSFSALVIVGNKKGKVGYGFGKAGDVSEAIRKAIENAKKQIITIKMYKSTIPHWVNGKSDTSEVLLKPAAPGTGIIAGGPVRIILEMAGCSDILSKCMGSRNAVNVVKATFDGLSQILSAKEVAKARDKSVRDIWS